MLGAADVRLGSIRIRLSFRAARELVDWSLRPLSMTQPPEPLSGSLVSNHIGFAGIRAILSDRINGRGSVRCHRYGP